MKHTSYTSIRQRMASITNVIIIEKETRNCGVCGKAGHNKRTCPQAEKAPKAVAAPLPPAKPVPVFWEPGMFLGGGVKAMPAAIVWKPGTNSLEFGAEMGRNPFYTYDKELKMYLRK